MTLNLLLIVYVFISGNKTHYLNKSQRTKPKQYVRQKISSHVNPAPLLPVPPEACLSSMSADMSSLESIASNNKVIICVFILSLDFNEWVVA